MRLALFILMLLVASSATALAGNKNFPGDMFYDRHWVYDRPYVPSDSARGADMFAPVPPLYNRNADMFDGLTKRATKVSTREDMFRTRWVHTAPKRPLVIDP
ncbi:MAG: hypothetical protein FWF24_04945 [Alphaproteobacteria bacterium]|nr:hypothetical protein [Alphaproteobacteria bacterium]